LARQRSGSIGCWAPGAPARRVGGDAAGITLADVVAAVDGSLMNVHGVSPDGLGYPVPAHRIAVVWQAVRVHTEEVFAGVTIADLLTDAPAEPAASLLRPGRATTLV
jgi:DNA-binding IscR family transcriptional regulator